MSDRFVWEEKDVIVRTNNSGLTCEDCMLKMEKPGWCGAYEVKPKSILNGGECKKKIPE